MKRLYLLLTALALGAALMGCHGHGYHHGYVHGGYHSSTYVSHAPYCGACHAYHHGPCH